jgi:hypothetical protein
LAAVLLPILMLALNASNAPKARAILRFSNAALVALAVVANTFTPRETKQIPGWTAVNTHFGDISQRFNDYKAAQFVAEQAAGSKARVLVFPEFLVPRWSEATDAFWMSTLTKCRRRGQILAIGAGVPQANVETAIRPEILKSYDFTAAVQSLRNPGGSARAAMVNPYPEPLDNTLLILGGESATFRQRIPVPLGMWRPFSRFSFPLRIKEPGIVIIDHRRAAVLICYEEMITWPVLVSMLQSPAVLIGISNTFWFNGTPIPQYQASALEAWARLFGIPALAAVNS